MWLLFALGHYLCQVSSHWFTHPQGHFKPLISTLSADNLIYSLQNVSANWPLFYLEVLPFMLSFPIYLQTCTSKKWKLSLTWLLMSASILDSSLSHFSTSIPQNHVPMTPIIPITTLTVQVLPVRFLMLVTRNLLQPAYQINGATLTFSYSMIYSMKTSHHSIKNLLNLALLFLTNFIFL